MLKKTQKRVSSDQILRKHLLYLLRGGGAHIHFDDLIDDFPIELIHRRIVPIPYTAWQLLEHMRIAQWDILEFSRNSKHVSPKWPEGYWPDETIVPDPKTWRESVKSFKKDLKAMEYLVLNPKTDLFTPIPWGDGQTILRETLLVADHNAYHLGSLMTMKRMLS